MASTIKDVAKLAGVSPSTVTRVLQDKSSISDATKKKVRQAMETLNYHPNVNARSLASNKTNVIGVVLPEDSDAFYQTHSSRKSSEGLRKSQRTTSTRFNYVQDKIIISA